MSDGGRYMCHHLSEMFSLRMTRGKAVACGPFRVFRCVSPCSLIAVAYYTHIACLLGRISLSIHSNGLSSFGFGMSFVHLLSVYQEHCKHTHMHMHTPTSNPSPNRIDLFSDHVNFKTFDHNRMISPHISMLFVVYRHTLFHYFI